MPPIHVPKNKHVALVCRNFDTGGIQTLFLRLIDAFKRRGIKVSIVADPGDLERSLPPDTKRYNSLYALETDPGCDLSIFCSGPSTLAQARVFQLLSRRAVAISCGVFYSRTFSDDQRGRVYNVICRRLLLRSRPESVFFMSNEVRAAHSRALGTDLGAWPVIRLPILAGARAQARPEPSETLRVISVGRLVDFKGYNRAAPRIVRLLGEAGVKVSWDIWGDGPDQEIVSNAIAAEDVEDRVRLRGTLPYADLAATFGKYDVFVGMGTAALEAAAMGLPTILAADRQEGRCLGFLHEQTSDSVAEFTDESQLKDIADCLTALARSDSAWRLETGEKDRQAYQKYASSLDEMADFITGQRIEKWTELFVRSSVWAELSMSMIVTMRSALKLQ